VKQTQMGNRQTSLTSKKRDLKETSIYHEHNQTNQHTWMKLYWKKMVF